MVTQPMSLGGFTLKNDDDDDDEDDHARVLPLLLEYEQKKLVQFPIPKPRQMLF